MSKSYSQVVKQIETLKVEAERLRRKEIDGVIARIREAVGFYKLTAADLGFGAPAPAPRATRVAAGIAMTERKSSKRMIAAPAVIKFRDEQGRGWVGRGKRPQWLRDALLAGKSLADFAVK